MKNRFFVLILLSIMFVASGCSPQKKEPAFTAEEFLYAKEQAEYLTEHLLSSFVSRLDTLDGKKSVEPLEVNTFVFWIGHIFDPMYDFPAYADYTLYQGFFHRGESTESAESTLEFPVAAVNQVVYEVFRIETWVLGENFITLNEEKQQYETNLEFGSGMGFQYRDLSSQVFEDTATVATNFVLIYPSSYMGDPSWDEDGYYTIAFQMMRENERVFLRFVEMKKCEQ